MGTKKNGNEREMKNRKINGLKKKKNMISIWHYLGSRLCSAEILAAAGVRSSILWKSRKKKEKIIN